MGQPIKDRGIKWTENYGDKSAYLKEEFEAQVGVGSYFRWEGHDFTTNTDYYVVVTPGYSKKHGYHFFAGLRKEPAENGASGKHFGTQGEALSYAIDKWNVPRPETAPHKPYIAKDLEGKPIVTENVHASSDAEIIRISGKDGNMVIIDETGDDEYLEREASVDEPMEKTAMALHSMKAPRFIPQYGKNTLPAAYQNAARASSIMGLRAALRTKLEFVTMDGNNWDKDAKGNDELSGRQGIGLPDSPLMATCSDVDPREFDQIVKQTGLSVKNKLFDFNRSGELELTEPSGNPSTNYDVIKFSHVANISPTIKVPFDKKAEFDSIVAGLNLRSDLNGNGVSVLAEERSPNAKKSNDYIYKGRIPIDLYQKFQESVSNLASIKAPKDFETENALRVYNYYEKKGLANTPEGKKHIMQTPMFEEYKGIKGGHALTFDKRGVPLGIDTAKSPRVGMEGSNPRSKMFVLKKSVLDSWNAQFNGDWGQIRDKLFSGEIPLEHSMFVDSRTCAPKMMPVYSQMPKVGMDLIPETENGQLVNEVKNVVPEYTISASNGVRVFNPQTGKMHFQSIPQDVQPEQSYNSMAVVLSSSKNYIPMDTGDGRTELREVDGGEWSMHDPESKGKFIPGKCYRFSITPKNASPKKTDAKDMHGLGLKRGGWGIYTSEVYANMEWHDGPPKSLDERAAAQEVVTGANGEVVGYYACVQRQYANKPWSTSAPTDRSPIEIPVHEQDANGNLMQTDRTFRLTPADAYKDSDADGVMITSLPKAVKFLQYKYGLSDQAFGPIPEVDDRDLQTIDEKVKVALTKIEAVKAGRLNPSALEPWEALLGKFPKGNVVPPDFFSALVEAQDDPASWEPKTGPIYGVFDVSENHFVEGEEFATSEKAENFKTFLNSHPQFQGKELQVAVMQENVPLTAAFRERLEQDPTAQFVSNKDSYDNLEQLADDETDGTEDVVPETESPVPQEEPANVPVPQEEPLQTSDVPYADNMLTDEYAPTAVPQQQEEPFLPMPPKKPVPAVPVSDTEASTLDRLIKLANKLDDEGKVNESQAVDRLISTLTKKFAGRSNAN